MAWFATITIIFIPILFSRDPDLGPRYLSAIAYLFALLIAASIGQAKKARRVPVQTSGSSGYENADFIRRQKAYHLVLIAIFGVAVSLATLATYAQANRALKQFFSEIIHIGHVIFPLVRATEKLVGFAPDRVQHLMACDTIFGLAMLSAGIPSAVYYYRMSNEDARAHFKSRDEERQRSGQKVYGPYFLLIFAGLLFLIGLLGVTSLIGLDQDGTRTYRRCWAIAQCFLKRQGDLYVIFGSVTNAMFLIPSVIFPALIKQISVK